MVMGRLEGGWSQIEDTSDPRFGEIAGFAVSEHNKFEANKLVFTKVISGQTQVVAGFKYRLVFEAKDDNNKVGWYEAVVWQMSWLKFKELLSFKLVGF